MNSKTIPPINNVNAVKKFFSSSLKALFPVKPQSSHSSGDIIHVIRNAISSREYIETYVRNSNHNHIPSADTVFRRIKALASESGSHMRSGSQSSKNTVHDGIEHISMIIDSTIELAIANNAFSHPVNVAIDEHDEPYYGIDNRYLINAPFHKFRGTNMAYRFATLESVKNGERLTLSIMKRNQLDGIDSALEVDYLLKHAMSTGIAINTVLMDRGYLNAGIIGRVESLKLKYIIPAKDNKKVLKYKKMDMEHCDNGISYLLINDKISSGKESAETEFVHIVYYPDRKRHDFSFYTNINVNEGNVREIAETYRERWGIENGYLEKKDVKERTHSPDMGVRYFLFYLSVLLYNMWVLLNLIRRISGYGWITLMDFIISMGRGKLNIIMNGNG